MNGLNGIQKDDLKRSSSACSDDVFGLIVHLFGKDTAIRFVRFFGGCNLYIPSERTVFRTVRDKKIREEFTGCNYDELAEKYCLSARQVRNIINKKEKGKKA